MLNFINQIKNNIYANTISTLTIVSLLVLEIMKWNSVYYAANIYKIIDLIVMYFILTYWITADFKFI